MSTYKQRYENTWFAAMTRLDFNEEDRLGLLFETTAMVLWDLAESDNNAIS